VQSARLTFTNVDSGGGTGTLDMTKQGSETRYTSFSAAPPDFAGAGCPTLIPANVSVGTKWSSSGISNGMNFTTDGEVQSVTDTVTVPAGTFTGCLRIYDVNTYADLATYIAQGGYGTIDRTRWFAPGVGLVKYASTVAKANGNEVITAPLVSYQLAGTPGATDWWPLALGSQWVYQESHMGTPTAWTVSTYTTQQ
jgi:hypothetical protein